MKPFPENLVSEQETQKLMVEAIESRVAKFTSQIEELDRTESENNYETFDPTRTAQMFDRSDVTIREYFYGEINNLRAGLRIISDVAVKEKISSQISALLIKINKVFELDDFMFEYLSVISALLTTVDHTSQTSGQEMYIETALSQVTKMISILKSTLETRQPKISVEIQEQINAVNKLLIKHKILGTITPQD